MLQLTPEQAIDYLNKRIEYDFNYLKRNTSNQDVSRIPEDIVKQLEEQWQSRGYKTSLIEDEAAKVFDESLKMFLPVADSRFFLVVQYVG